MTGGEGTPRSDGEGGILGMTGREGTPRSDGEGGILGMTGREGTPRNDRGEGRPCGMTGRGEGEYLHSSLKYDSYGYS